MLWNNISFVVEKTKKCRQLVGVFILIIYSIVGSVIFCAIEAPAEEASIVESREEQRQRLERARHFLASDLQIFFRNQINISSLLSSEFRRVVEDYNRRVGLENPYTDVKPQWDFYGGLYYSGTLYTTIGYGDIYTKTIAGKIVTIVYSLIGIPLLIAVLESFGSVIFNSMQLLWMKYLHHLTTCCHFSLNRKMSTVKLLAEDGKPIVIKQPVMPLSMGIAFLCLWVMGGAGIFCLFEPWDFFSSIYFFYISLVTIGLGDITPDHKTACLNFFVILGGLSVVSTSIKIIQEHIEVLFGDIVKSIEEDFKKQLMEERRKSMAVEANVGTQTGLLDAELGQKQVKKEKPHGIKKYEETLSTGQKFMMKLMSNHQKKLLNNKIEEKEKLRNRGTQTEDNKRSTVVQTEAYPGTPEYEEEPSEEEEEHALIPNKDGSPARKPLFGSKRRRKLYIYNTD